ncbi:MAG TPA: BTAD domain-containing putative transcriptional regulator [Candidatus Dormibacteraeota bacterium]|nr:BTAD domain-containing putative transcriptional regulator [Candidatus Dormibacteraeota bacterium]
MVRVYLAGELCLTTGSGVIRADRLPGRQGRIAFALLADRRAHPVSRDELAEAVWPDSLPAAHEVALSAIVSKLRGLLDEVGLGRTTLVAEAGCYQLVLPRDAWVDVEVAIESVHMAEAALAADDPEAAYGPGVVANAILRRPFLPGLEGTWIESRRDSLRTAQLRALDCLAQIHAWNGEEALALRAAREAVSLEPYRESGYRRLMQLHDRAGNRAEALRVYDELTSLLAAELSTSPSQETRALVETIGSSR